MWVQALTHMLHRRANTPVHDLCMITHTQMKSEALCATVSILRNSADYKNSLTLTALSLCSISLYCPIQAKATQL